MVRWFRRLITVGLALVLALLIGPVASRASLMDLMPQLEGQGSVQEQLNQTLEGKFELAIGAIIVGNVDSIVGIDGD